VSTDRQVAAARAVAASLGLAVDEAIVQHESNAVTVRLVPCDMVARVEPAARQNARFQVGIAHRLAEAGSPVAVPVPDVYEHDGFVVTLWTWYAPGGEISPAEYARALGRLHTGMRTIDVPSPHWTDRIGEAQQLVADPGRTPDLIEADRDLLGDTLRRGRRVVAGRGAPEQLLHGEPHPGNLLSTADGPRFIDFETCCRGPVEFDLAHAPEEVAEFYPDVDQDLIGHCRVLVLAMNTMWRWDANDQLPGGRRLAAEWIGRIRDAARPGTPG
jgi:hypothetical protein